MVSVSLAQVQDDLYSTFVQTIDDIGQRVISSGDRVLIKPNLVSPGGSDSGRITSPALIEAVARYCLDLGASRVTIGEGPSYYNKKSLLHECFTRTGVSEIAERLGIDWVSFDDRNFRTFRNVSDCTPDVFRITELAFECDRFINIPVLKTHYLTSVTLAMKNLKGCLKWEDKPLFHRPDLSRAVVELNKIIRPTLNVIDATNWKRGGAGILIVSTDIVAVDAVGCALMGIDPSQVRMVKLGNEAGLGESDITRIDIIGEELKRLEFKVRLPQEQLRQYFPLLEIRGAEDACSGCLIPVVSSLMLLGECGAKMGSPLTICLGRGSEVPQYKSCLLVGDCADVADSSPVSRVAGCPPDKGVLYDFLAQAMGMLN